MLRSGLAVPDGVERFRALGHDEPRLAPIAIDVFPTERRPELEAERVVAIDHRIDGRQGAVLPEPSGQAVQRGRRPLRVATELTEGALPGRDVGVAPGWQDGR